MEICDNIPGTRMHESLTYYKSVSKNKRKIKLLIKCSNFAYGTLEKLSKIKPIYKDEELALLLISSKNFRSLCVCFKLLVTGNYYDVYIILRTLLDSYLLMIYLKSKPKQVKKWIKGINFKVGNMQDELKHNEFKNLWSILGNFIHTNYEAAIYNTYHINKIGKTRFMTAPIYEKELFGEAYSAIIYSYVKFFDTIRFCFGDLLIKEDKKRWHKDLRKLILIINKMYT